MPKPRFDFRPREKRTDKVGHVVIKIYLQDPDATQALKGNMIRQFRISGTKVSLVAKAIEKFLTD